MRWKINNPKLGDVRIKKKFAWLPTSLTDKLTRIWLEKYTQTEHYINTSKPNWLNGVTVNSTRWVVCKKE